MFKIPNLNLYKSGRSMKEAMDENRRNGKALERHTLVCHYGQVQSDCKACQELVKKVKI